MLKHSYIDLGLITFLMKKKHKLPGVTGNHLPPVLGWYH